MASIDNCVREQHFTGKSIAPSPIIHVPHIGIFFCINELAINTLFGYVSVIWFRYENII